MKSGDNWLLKLGAIILLIFAIIIFAAAQRPTRKRPVAPATPVDAPESAREPAALAFTLTLPWPQIYRGDPLCLQGSIDSPRARAEEFKQLYLLEQGATPPPASFAPPAIAADWYNGVSLTLYKLDNRGKKEQLIAGNWKEFLLSESDENSQASLDAMPQIWLIPVERLRLEEGRYQLEGVWNGKDRVDSALLGPQGNLKAETLLFTVKAVANSYENGIHLQRLAQDAYLRKQYENAIKYGQDAITQMGSEMKMETVEIYFTVANAQTGLKDYRGALASYQELLGKLPDQNSELSAIINERIETLKKRVQ